MKNNENETTKADYFGMFNVEQESELDSILDVKHSQQAIVTLELIAINLIEIEELKKYKSNVKIKISGIGNYGILQVDYTISAKAALSYVSTYDLAAASVFKLKQKVGFHLSTGKNEVEVQIKGGKPDIDVVLEKSMREGMENYPSFSHV